MDVSRIEKVGGVYMPTEATTLRTMTYANGSVVRYHTHSRPLLIDVTPDFNAIPDAFVLDAPDGTVVHDFAFPAAKLEWRGGKAVTLANKE